MQNYNKTHAIKTLAILLVAYFCLAAVFFWASGDQLYFTTGEEPPITPKDCAAVMTDGTVVRFSVQPQTEYLDRISLLVGTYGRDNHGSLVMEVFSPEGKLLGNTVLSTSGLPDYVYQDFLFDHAIDNAKGQVLNVVVTAADVPDGEGTSLWYGTEITAGKFSVPDLNGDTFTCNDTSTEGKICYVAAGRDILWIGQWYWLIVCVIAAVLLAYALYARKMALLGKETMISRAYVTVERYSFLVRQLVGRDFKRKYKRSVLGVLWSFLNPLMTMMVQYFVFSTIFKSTIENFIVYLLSGIILFNFFGESVGLGLTSILDNAHLINKVYMPKEIYPLSRVLSSLINLLLSLLPLFIVMIVTGVPFTKAMLLIPIGLICLIFFCLGMSMLLSCSMVFFQDTLFLWNVVSTLWMYLTPTFYPETIIPAVWLPLYRLNPMYQYITFLRVILLDGMAPSPSLYVGCIASAALMFLAGLRVFQKNQNKFVLHL